MICVALREPDIASCLQALDEVEMAEIRLDRMTVTPADVRTLFARPQPLIATCRAGRYDQAGRRELLAAAAAAGAAYIDVEDDAPEEYRRELAAVAHAHGGRVIVSHHDFAKTPETAALQAWMERFAAEADLLKIACQVNRPDDNIRLLALLEHPPRPLVVIGMGPLGRITRLAAPLLGSPFTFASRRPGAETAAGQFDAATLARLLREVQP